MQVVWFKRDLRSVDHRALALAAAQGDVLPLYVVEPELWAEPDMSARQWAFVEETLSELREALGALGQPLVIRLGDVCDVLSGLKSDGKLTQLWSHEGIGQRLDLCAGSTRRRMVPSSRCALDRSAKPRRAATAGLSQWLGKVLGSIDAGTDGCRACAEAG